MFSRMSKRERFLALLVACMLPMLVGFAFFWWVYGSYQDNRMELRSLRTRIGDERDRELEMMMASERRDWYRSVSLPANVDEAKTQYVSFLYDLGDRTLDFDSFTPKPRQEREIKFRNRSEVAYQLTYDASFDASYEQLVDFMFEFYRVKLLHRISGLSITPLNTAKGERTGVLRVRLTIDAIALLDADLQRDFRDCLRDELGAGRDLAFYKDALLPRDLFSGPNMAPEIVTKTSHTFEEGDRVEINLTAEDLNENQKLEFALLDKDSTLAQATLQPGLSGNSAKFDAGRLDPGTYRFAALVRDSGFPRKEKTKQFVVRVEKKQEEKVVDDTPPPPPPFQHAKGTRITALVRGVDGAAEVWIDTKTLPDEPVYYLGEGDEFELDDDTWKVVKISLPDDVVIRRSGRDYSYHSGQRLYVEGMDEAIATSGPEDGASSENGANADEDGADEDGADEDGAVEDGADDTSATSESEAASDQRDGDQRDGDQRDDDNKTNGEADSNGSPELDEVNKTGLANGGMRPLK